MLQVKNKNFPSLAGLFGFQTEETEQSLSRLSPLSSGEFYEEVCCHIDSLFTLSSTVTLNHNRLFVSLALNVLIRVSLLCP